MARTIRYIGIDFGTTYSKIAYYNPETEEAQIMLFDGKEQIPSLIYFGKDGQIKVGEDASGKLEEEEEEEEDPQEWRYVVQSVKRDLLQPGIPLPHRNVTPVEVVTEILRTLKEHAEEEVFHEKGKAFQEEVKYVTLTHPVTFGEAERNILREAALAAGFQGVNFFQEPIAAAIAYGNDKIITQIEKNILVYDLGGGTFDLALLMRQEDESFQTAPHIEVGGIKGCAGDDFDHKLYDYFDQEVRRKCQRGITLDERINLPFLKQCRDLKENLTNRTHISLAYLLQPDGPFVRLDIRRSIFNELIGEDVAKTVKETRAVLEAAKGEGYEIETGILIGGASRVPLIEDVLKKELPEVRMRRWKNAHTAVALGAAYEAYRWWRPEAQYRRLVEQAKEERPLTVEMCERLQKFAQELGEFGLKEQEIAAIELEMLTFTKESFLAHHAALERYKEGVREIRSALLSLKEIALDVLGKKVKSLNEAVSTDGLGKNETILIEQEILGDSVEKLLNKQNNRAQYRMLVKEKWQGKFLQKAGLQELENFGQKWNLDEKDRSEIERQVMGETKEEIYNHQMELISYADAVKELWKQQKEIDETSLEALRKQGLWFHLSEGEAARIEREEMGATKEEKFGEHKALRQYERKLEEVGRQFGDRIDEALYRDLLYLEQTLHLRADDTLKLERKHLKEEKREVHIRHLSEQIYRERVKELRQRRGGEITREDIDELEKLTSSLGIANTISGPIESVEIGRSREEWLERLAEQQATRFMAAFVIAAHKNDVMSLLFSPDGKTLISCSADTYIKYWKVSDWTMTASFYGTLASTIGSIALDKEGQLLVSAGWNKKICLWNRETGKRLNVLTGHTGAVRAVAISPNGRQLASGGEDRTVRLWSLQYKQELLQTWNRHKGGIDAVTFSPDGKWLASGGRDNIIYLRGVVSGSLVWTLTGHTQGICALVFSPDSRYLVSGSDDKTIKIWDVETGKLLRTLSGHSAEVNSVDLSPDGRLVVSGSQDKTVRLWLFKTGKQVAELTGHTGAVYKVVFSPNGEIVASGGVDKTIRIWKVKTR